MVSPKILVLTSTLGQGVLVGSLGAEAEDTARPAFQPPKSTFKPPNQLSSQSSPTTVSFCAAHALLTPLVNPGSLYRGGEGAQSRAACGPWQEEAGPEILPKTTSSTRVPLWDSPMFERLAMGFANVRASRYAIR